MATAESVSTRIDTIRNCTIEINNMSNIYNLINPKVFTFSGHCCSLPEPTISSNKTGICAFTKTEFSARGAVGVLTYDLCHMENQACSERMALLFSIPFDYVLYDGMWAVGVFDITRECDKALYYSMYEGKQTGFIRENAKVSEITYKGETVELKATMSNVDKAIIKLEIRDNNKSC
ncbi:tereporin-Ca1-like [Misgurnus anguillicaudatus]|uniref:tereporin-Ca1-like n=1 Tax=Misgurnus anguillicaudatus TaxID=75329 RepID=UPI003CCFC6D5